jgi:hypothetical protein
MVKDVRPPYDLIGKGRRSLTRRLLLFLQPVHQSRLSKGAKGMSDTTNLEYQSHEWMTFIAAVRHVAAATEYQSDDDPIDNIARGLDFVRSALIEGKIPIEWVEDRYGRGFNPYVLYGIDQPRDDLEWAIRYIAEEAGIPNPRPSYMSKDLITGLRRLRQLRLLKKRVLELWPNRSATQSDGPKDNVDMQATRSPLSKEQLKALVREELRAIYKTSRPNTTVAEQLVRKLTEAPRSIIRPILEEDEFSRRRLPPGNSRRSNS